MNHASEHDIDRILTALRDTQPSEGMESRILQAMEQRTPARSAWFRFTPSMQWGLAALATSAVIFAVAFTYNTRRANSDSVASAGASQNPVISTGAQRSGEIAAFPEASATHTPAHLKAASSTQPAYPPHELLCDCDRLAMDEMQAPSHPAPEMPLTAQERLLQRVVHREDPIEIAELELPNRTLQPASVTKENDAVRNVVQGFLKQLAAAEAISPTAPTPEPPPAFDSGANDPGPSAETPVSPN